MHRSHSITVPLAVVAMLFLAAATASAQNTLQLSQTSFTFTAAIGSTATQQQVLFILTSGGAVSYTSSIQQNGNWLSLTPPSGSAPIASYVVVNPSGLGQGTYVGTIAIAASGVANSPQSLTVTLVVGSGTATSPLAASPAAVNFNYTLGGTLPAGQTVSVTSSTPQGFTASVSTASGGNWLTVNPVSATTPATVILAANPAGMAQGAYNGSLVLTPSGFLGSPLTVAVTLTVASTPELKASSLQPFNYQAGGAAPASQTLSLTSTGATLPFAAVATTQSGGNWLVLSQSGGATPADLTVSVNSAVLAALPGGSYTGSITIAAPSASNPTTTISVTLNISANPFVNVSPASLSFTVQPGGSLPQAQNLSVTATAQSYPFTAIAAVVSGPNWLTVTPSAGTTPGTVAVSLNSSATNLLPGNYSGSVIITAPNAANPTATIPVTLTVTNTPALIANPPSLYFNFQTGRATPPIQTVAIASSGIPAQFSVTTATAKGGQWLQVSPAAATTPSMLTVLVNPAGLNPDTYTGTITLTPSVSGAAPLTINVIFTVSNSALLNASPSAVPFNVPQGTASTSQNVALTSTGDPLNFSVTFATTSGGANWLLVGPLAGTTPANLQVFLVPGSLGVGTYTGTITVSVVGANSQTIPVTLTVTTGASLKAEPSAINFTQTQGGAAPAPQTISLTASGTAAVSFAASATTSACGNWLTVEPPNSATPAQLRVTAAAVSVVAGTPCFGLITVVAPGAVNSPLQLPVTLNVVPQQTLAVNPASLNFNYQVGGTAPSAMSLQVGSTPGTTNFTFASATQSGGDWLSVTSSSGTTPATLSVSVRTQVLSQAGSYTGSITLTSPGASNSPLAVSVTLTVTAGPVPRVTTVRNAASYVPGAVAPGEIVYIEGANVGPAALTTLKLNAQGMVDTLLAETRVLFDGIPSPLIYVWNDRLSCIVPYGIAGRVTTRMQVEYKNQLSAAIEFGVTDAAPGLFTMNQQGSGQGAILNQDYSVNGPQGPGTKPAERGSVVMIYATGEGPTTPPGVDGKVNTATPYPRPLLPVTVLIDGRDAEVLYAGAAPNFVSGAMQINVRIPAATTPGNAVSVQVRAGTRTSQSGVTLAVQ
ncbi:MAG: hypothetical protein HY822_03470 [Acidobacteria bacterium]|nr:hypothetical protein [Acidobacteriota bacterium]